MAKHVSGIRDTEIFAFPGINITRLNRKITQGLVDLSSQYIILHVGTNDISSSLLEDEIVAMYNDLISVVRSKSDCKILVSAILPRPIDFDATGNRVKKVNNSLATLCRTRKASFVKSFKPFLKCGVPRREYFAVRDGGLHLNIEGIRRLREFFINTIAHLS